MGKLSAVKEEEEVEKKKGRGGGGEEEDCICSVSWADETGEKLAVEIAVS